VENARLETNVRQSDVGPVLAVSGEIDVYTAPMFKQAVVGLVTDGTQHVFIDMNGVTYMDSSGFGALLGATKRLRPAGGALHLVGAKPTVERMLHLTRLDTVIEMHSTLDQAIAAARHGAKVAA
jgi:anti-sigma B factor antagonist